MFKLTIYREMCCDTCNEVIHHHFNCPACGKEYAGTDAYGSDLCDKGGAITLRCEECGARFRTTGDDPYDEDVEQWELVD